MKFKRPVLYGIAGIAGLMLIGASILFQRVDVETLVHTDITASYVRSLETEADKFIDRHSNLKEIQPEFASDDMWGTRFKVWEQGGKIHVLSAGPDRAFGTNDDIRFSKELPHD